jgi:carbonic anhydrase
MITGPHKYPFRYKAFAFPLALSSVLILSACEKTPTPAPKTAPAPAAVVENTAPFANAGEDITSKRNLTITLDGSNSNDIDGGDLTYRWQQTGGPAVELNGADTATPSFIGPKDAELLEFTLVVNDGEADSEADKINVHLVRSPAPRIDTESLISAQRGETVKLNASQTITSDLPTSVEWRQTHGPAVTLDNANSLTPSFTAPSESGHLIFEVTIRDNEDGEGKDSVTVEINNRPPIARASTAHDQVTPGSKVSLSARGSQDPEGDTLVYRWKQVLGSEVTLENVDTSSPYFSAPSFADHLVFSLSVSDGEFTSHQSKVHVKVKPKAVVSKHVKSDVVLSTSNGGPITIDVSAKPNKHNGDINWDTKAIADQADKTHWSYEGHGSPSHWGDLKIDYATCGTGMEQSPIDISNVDTRGADAIAFHYQPSKLNIVNNGHTIQANYDAGSYIERAGKRFDLLQLHFHAPSEHTIDGEPADMVAHLVHKAEDGQLAVVGVLFAEDAANEFITPIWDNMPTHKGKVATDITIDANSLLPVERSYYHYAGSLTTPPCSEGVSWNVLENTVTVSADQVAAFKAIFPLSVRPTQAINGRNISKH